MNAKIHGEVGLGMFNWNALVPVVNIHFTAPFHIALLR